MFDLFAAAPKDLRAARLEEYGEYLVERDGEMNFQMKTLARREANMKKYESTSATPRVMDEREFRKQYVSFDERKPLPEEMLLLLALVKVNAAEAYGVAQNLQRATARAIKNEDESELRILLEEGYHTRILLSSANHYGIEVREPYAPPSALRVMIGGIATAPMAIARPLTLAGEIIATLMFTKLIQVTQRVLKHDPQTRDAVTERIVEICADECGHITYNRMHMGPLELAQTRLILPMTAQIMGTVFKEMVAIDAYPHDVMRELPRLDPRNLPECVRGNAFVA